MLPLRFHLSHRVVRRHAPRVPLHAPRAAAGQVLCARTYLPAPAPRLPRLTAKLTFAQLDVYENEAQLPGDARHALLPRPPTASGSTSYHLQEPFRPPPHPRSLYDAPPFHDAQPFVYVPPTLPQPGAYHTSSYQHHFSPPYYLEANAGPRSLYAPVVPPQPGHQLLANYAGGPAHIPPPPLQFDSTFKPAAAPFPPVAEPPKKKKAPRRPSTQKFVRREWSSRPEYRLTGFRAAVPASSLRQRVLACI